MRLSNTTCHAVRSWSGSVPSFHGANGSMRVTGAVELGNDLDMPGRRVAQDLFIIVDRVEAGT